MVPNLGAASSSKIFRWSCNTLGVLWKVSLLVAHVFVLHTVQSYLLSPSRTSLSVNERSASETDTDRCT